MTCKQFDPECPDCRPLAIDPRTGQQLPADHPATKILQQAFDSLPLQDKEAVWRVWVLSSETFEDRAATLRLWQRVQDLEN